MTIDCQISSRDDVTHACHYVVHGGGYPAGHVIDKDTYHHLEDLTDLAPLHNSNALAIIRSSAKDLPTAYFGSSSHGTIPEAVRTYPVDPEVAK